MRNAINLQRQVEDGATSPSLAARWRERCPQSIAFYLTSELLWGRAGSKSWGGGFFWTQWRNEMVWKKIHWRKKEGKKDLLASNPHYTYFSDHPNINYKLSNGKLTWILVVHSITARAGSWHSLQRGWRPAQEERSETGGQGAQGGMEVFGLALVDRITGGEEGPLF
jgi:hypothetical protein